MALSNAVLSYVHEQCLKFSFAPATILSHVPWERTLPVPLLLLTVGTSGLKSPLFLALVKEQVSGLGRAFSVHRIQNIVLD